MAKTRASQIVVVGASAGGIEAISSLVGGLDAGFPAPVVIAQHLDPRRSSHLPEILTGRTSMTVTTVTDSAKLEGGVVYVVPANRDVEITDHEVRVHEDAERKGPRPSVDRLMATAATSFGEHLIAVILSGEGSDGAEGARAVKLAGGTVVIQDPLTAAHPSMPMSLAPTTVDIVAPVETIPSLLRDLISGVRVDQPGDDALLERFLGQVREQTGIDFASYKRPTITRRLQRRMAAVGVTTLPDYVRFVTRNPTEYDRLASGFLIKVTEFFRDPDLFTYLSEEIVPRIIRYASEREREIRIWSAGCATGEEAYSLAILFAEALGDSIGKYSVRVFATDLDADAVNFARRGLYSRSAVANLPPDILDRYFQRVGDDFEIRKDIRALTVFGQHDLAQRAPFPRIDLAVTRNVLIYFTPELQKRALQLFAFSLRDDGILVLGKAESTSQLPQHFAPEEPRLKVYRRHGERMLILPTRSPAWIRQSPPASEVRSSLRAPSSSVGTEGGTIRDSRPTIAEKSEQILLRLPTGVVLVDKGYDIQLINPAARRALEIHGTAVDQDFVHLASVVPSQPLRSGIDRAIEGETSSVELRTEDTSAGGVRILRLTFEGHRLDGAATAPDSALIIVEDMTELATRRSQLEDRATAATSELSGLTRRADLLTRTNEELLVANHELTLANAELRSANEELLVGSEEVQAATEEVETLNEELQATNEELETLNEELQATVEELNTTNDDLEARSADLEGAASVLRGEQKTRDAARRNLSEGLLGASEGVAILDHAGQPVTPTDLVSLLAEARPLDELTVGGRHGLRARVLRGERVVGRFEIPGRGRARRVEIVGEPIRDSDGEVVGALLTMRPTRRAQAGRS
jgi:two-component system, chemotaxis family, CheB/CheR fusion protein